MDVENRADGGDSRVPRDGRDSCRERGAIPSRAESRRAKSADARSVLSRHLDGGWCGLPGTRGATRDLRECSRRARQKSKSGGGGAKSSVGKKKPPARRRDDDDEGGGGGGAETVLTGTPSETGGEIDFGFERTEALTGRRRKAEKAKSKSGGFEGMDLLPEVFRAIKRKGYRISTPIQ